MRWQWITIEEQNGRRVQVKVPVKAARKMQDGGAAMVRKTVGDVTGLSRARRSGSGAPTTS